MNVIRGEALRRYSRHLLIPEVALEGQERLAAARVLCIGAGGLGAPVLAYLAAAGVGRVGIMDDDVVDLTNLQRQVLFSTADIGRKKVEVAAERLHGINPDVSTDQIYARFSIENAMELVGLYDLVIDCTDRFETRYLVNDAAYFAKKPDVYASIFRFDGQVSVFDTAGGGPCYRCLFPEMPPEGAVPSCAEGGVLGVLAGIVGTLQASEVLKMLIGIGDPLRGRLLLVDALGAAIQQVEFARDAACALCGDAPTITELRPEKDAPNRGVDVEEIAPQSLDAALQNAILLDVREPHEAILGTPKDAVAIPASQLEARLHELDTAKRYIVACRVGARSRWAVARLQDAGFGKLAHLDGGLLAYAACNSQLDVF